MRERNTFRHAEETRMELFSGLEKALECGQVWPAFQPIVHLRSEALAGFEILARWTDPDAGDISPSQFVPILDQHQLVDTLLEGLMRSACAAAVQWDGNFFLAFNVTPSQILSGDLPDRLSAIASQTGFPLARIQLEITECSLISDDAAAFRTLDRLSEIGVAISIDDFGTGYSNFARLEAFPFRKLKIDAQFIRGLEHDNRKRRIVSAVVGLGQSLGITVVGEGVETESEAAILRTLGCPLGQGWLFGKGVPVEEAKRVNDRLAGIEAPTCLLDTSPFQQLHQLETLYNQAPVGLCFLDLQYRHVRTNDLFAAMHGLTGRQLEGKSIYDVMHGETIRRVEGVLGQAVGPDPLPPQDYLIANREYRVFAQTDQEIGGENIGFSIVSIDVTEQNRIMRTLKESEEHFRRAVELNPDIA
jgi:PAS domain S-box-containing protein